MKVASHLVRNMAFDLGAIKAFKEVYHESKTVREAHVREVQDH